MVRNAAYPDKPVRTGIESGTASMDLLGSHFPDRDKGQRNMSNNSPEAIVTYFPTRGRAEPIRLLLEDQGVPWRDDPVPVEEWRRKKREMPFGKLPVFRQGDLEIPESHAILRHLAHRHELYGRDGNEAIRCDILQEVLHDAIEQFADLMWDQEFADKREGFTRKRLIPMLKNLERFLENTNASRSHWIGSGNTYVDYIGHVYLDMVRALATDVLQSFDRLWELYQAFQERPRIRAYRESDRRYPTLTVPMASFGNTPETS
jgi:glutathione S-transferase